MSRGLTVRWVSHPAELRTLGEAYDRMVLAAGGVGLFYRTGWVERAWPYYRAKLGGELAFLVVKREDTLVGVAPLQLRTKDWAHARQRVLGFFGGTTDELDDWVPTFVFGEPGRGAQREQLHAIVDALERHQDRWDLLDLRFLPASCPSREVLRGRLAGLVETPDPLTTPRACLQPSTSENGAARFALYRAGRSKRLLRMVERGEKRAAEDGVRLELEVSTRVTAEQRARTEVVHRARQDHLRAIGRPRTSPFEEPEAAAIFWDLVEWAGAAGHLRAYWLHAGDRPAAFVYAMCHAGTVYSWFNAIDPGAERYHPGNVLLARVIEAEVREHGAEIIDLMAGPNLTKELFATEALEHVGVVAPNPHRLVAKARHVWVAGAKQVLSYLAT